MGRRMNVAVLMSTYNGEKYIKEQITSILNQENVNILLMIRDDGSSNKTMEVLEKSVYLFRFFCYYILSNIGITMKKGLGRI